MTQEEIQEFLEDAPDVRTTARRAVQFIDVLVSRAQPGTAYVPMAGGRR